MKDQRFDTMSRRLALTQFGTAGFTAVGYPALASAGRKQQSKSSKKAKAKADKKARQKCRSQVSQCRSLLQCGDAECAQRLLTCCGLLGNCDIAGMMDCMFAPFEEEP